MAVAQPVYADWATLYPELASGVPEARFDLLVAQSALYLRNDDTSPVTDVNQRTQLIYLIVAHLAALVGAGDGGASAGAVGPVQSATEGDVSVTRAIGAIPGSALWFGQTGYGLSYWQATAGYRTFQYRAAAPRWQDPAYGYPGRRRVW